MALPCIEMLAATPEVLRGLMSEISDEDARWKPAPDRFSIAEVLAHLSHSEGHCYRLRLDRFMAEERPELSRTKPPSTSIFTAMRIPKTLSTTSRINASPTLSCSAPSQTSREAGWRFIARPARSR